MVKTRNERDAACRLRTPGTENVPKTPCNPPLPTTPQEGRDLANAPSADKVNVPTGSSTTGLPRRCSVEHATPTMSNTNGTPSSQVTIATTDTNTVPTQSNDTTTTTSTTNKKKRNRWTRVEKVNLFRCYTHALQLGLPKTQGTFDIWRKKFPNQFPDMTPTTLNTQRRYIEQNNLSQAEIEQIREEVKNETKTGTEHLPMVTPEPEDPTPTPPIPNHTERTTPGTDIIHNDTPMYDALVTTFTAYRDLPFDERNTPKKVRYSKDIEEKVKEMNECITIFLLQNQSLTLSDLNTLHYAAALTIAGAPECRQLRTDKAKEDPLVERIENKRKWIGRLTAATKSEKVSNKVKKYLKKRNIQETLTILKMQLAAMVKKQRTRAAKKKRSMNNKAFYSNKKAFYATLRNKEAKSIPTELPTKENITAFWGGLWQSKGPHNRNSTWIK